MCLGNRMYAFRLNMGGHRIIDFNINFFKDILNLKMTRYVL